MQSVFKKAFPFPDYSSFQKKKKINLLIIVELFRLYLIFSTNHVIRTEKYEECLHLAISSFIMYLPFFFHAGIIEVEGR